MKGKLYSMGVRSVNPNPTVSLCMVVQDDEALLKKSLDSAIHIIDEIIIVDRGSNDSSVEIAKQYGAYVIHAPCNRGIAETKNDALQRSSGDWVLVLNAGEQIDTSSQEKLKQLLGNSAEEGYYFKRKRSYPDGTAIIDRTFALFRKKTFYRFQGVWGEDVTPHPERVREVDDIIIHLSLSDHAAHHLQRNADVIAQYSQAHPDDPSVYYWLAVQFLREGWVREACNEFERAASCLKPDFAYYSHTLYLLAQCYLMLQQTKKCLTVIESALSRFPDFADLYCLQAIAYMYGEQWERAIDSMLRCAALPKPPLRYVSQENLQEVPRFLSTALYSAINA